MKPRRNPAAGLNLTRADAFGLVGSAVGYSLGRMVADWKPPAFKRFKPNISVAHRMMGVCHRCSHWGPWLERPFVSPEERKIYARACPMCGRNYAHV